MVVTGNFRSHAELRRKPRRQFHYNARILTDREAPPIACSIADISETGARLILESDSEVADKFVLLFTPKGNPRRHCTLIWRDGLTLGVEFPQEEEAS
jgi:methyl-accepting chemotaxis protein